MKGLTNILLVGFDSAWSNGNNGAITAVFADSHGSITEITPEPVSLDGAVKQIEKWQNRWSPDHTIVAIDQPIIVENETGQRPVENVVSSIIGKHGGGVQPTSKERLHFRDSAPIWDFVVAFDGPADPSNLASGISLVETYPALCLITMGYTLPTENGRMRLPKYNPTNKNFNLNDWHHVCSKVHEELQALGLANLATAAEAFVHTGKPSKAVQDKLDSFICLLTAYSVARGTAMSVGTVESGYMVAPLNEQVAKQLRTRCIDTARNPDTFVHVPEPPQEQHEQSPQTWADWLAKLISVPLGLILRRAKKIKPLR
jgi:predicted RNase H-like nuclease